VPVGGIGEPWRHLPRLHSLPDCLRPGLGLFVGHEGHGSNFAGAVANLTMPLQNREHVFVKRQVSCRFRRLPGLQRERSQAEQEQQRPGSPIQGLRNVAYRQRLNW
jgi:hypothetical protein